MATLRAARAANRLVTIRFSHYNGEAGGRAVGGSQSTPLIPRRSGRPTSSPPPPPPPRRPACRREGAVGAGRVWRGLLGGGVAAHPVHGGRVGGGRVEQQARGRPRVHPLVHAAVGDGAAPAAARQPPDPAPRGRHRHRRRWRTPPVPTRWRGRGGGCARAAVPRFPRSPHPPAGLRPPAQGGGTVHGNVRAQRGAVAGACRARAAWPTPSSTNHPLPPPTAACRWRP
jgi:hypothetical protein